MGLSAPCRNSSTHVPVTAKRPRRGTKYSRSDPIFSQSDLAALRLGMWPVEDDHVADERDEMAGALLREHRRQLLLLFLELVELHLDEFVVRQGLVHRLQEGVAQAGLADLEGGFEPLGKGLELADLRSGQRRGHFNLGKNSRAVAHVAALNSSSVQPLTWAAISEISFT